MGRLKYGDDLTGYGRNKGGRYLHKIRGGEFREGVPNHALCWNDVTRAATEDDYHREVCGECLNRPEAEWSEEDRVRFERVSVLSDLSTSQHMLEQALRTIPGALYEDEEAITAAVKAVLLGLKGVQNHLKSREA